MRMQSNGDMVTLTIDKKMTTLYYNKKEKQEKDDYGQK